MFSQNKEEEVILNYFGDHIGTFCSIGENDGVTLSNTRALALKGWSGVCVEPSPLAFIRLKGLYDGNKNVYCYNFAISTHNGRTKFFESGNHLNANDVGLLSTSNTEELTRFPGTKYTEMEVKCFRWKTALNRFRIKKFDFISLDAEGLDFEILEQIDLSYTKLLCVEWNLKPELKAKYTELLTSSREAVIDHFISIGFRPKNYTPTGFKIIYESPENLIYAR